MERRVTILLGLVLLACGAVPAGAHVGEIAKQANVERGMFGDQPIPAVARQSQDAPEVATPKADCRPGSKPEPGLQGRVAKADVDSGAAGEGYWCNVKRIGQSGATGGFKVLRYTDENGHECAFYDTTLLFPTNALNLSLQPTGVAVLDMSNPAQPKRTDTLLTPAMQTPHESLNLSVQRGILAAVMGNPAFAPGVVDVYDVSKDCRRPVLQSSAPVGWLGHESGMAPDGKTFYATSIGTGQTTAVDLTNPQVPLPLWIGQYDSHGMTVSDDGNRGYLAAGSGLIILDLSEIQARKPDPQVREISRLVWPNMTIPQVAHPVTIKGKPYLVEVDEYSYDSPGGGLASHGPVVGAARIIDISDETKPRVVSQIRLDVHQREHRDAIAGDYGVRFQAQGYAAHYCNVPQRVEPGIVACSMILSGLRVFDIRDPEKPREIAYHVAPPSNVSETGSPYIDEKANYAMSQPAFVPERGEIWYSDGTTGFWALRVDPEVWPFTSLRTADGCVDNRGFASVSARRRGSGLALNYKARVKLPVRVDVFRVSQGRRVIKERRVARYANARDGLVWRGKIGPGYYFARFTMLKDGKPYDTRRVVLERTVNGNFVPRPDHFRRDSCGLLGKFKLSRPVFGGPSQVGLEAAYRLTSPAQVRVTVTRAGRVVKRFAAVNQPANRTLRVRIPARGLRRGTYTVRLSAARGDDQVVAKLVARRL